VSEETGPAAGDRPEDLAVADRDTVSKLLEVSRCVLPEAVRDSRHGLLAPEQLLDDLACVGFG